MARPKLDKQFEDDVQGILEKLKNKGLLSYVRLYDTKSARGNYLPEQPGDFIVASKMAHLLECKTSEVHDSLAVPKCLSANVKPHQAAEHRLWVRSGNPAWFLFYSQPRGVIELWPGAEVGEAYVKKTKLIKPYIEVHLGSLEDLIYTHFCRNSDLLTFLT